MVKAERPPAAECRYSSDVALQQKAAEGRGSCNAPATREADESREITNSQPWQSQRRTPQSSSEPQTASTRGSTDALAHDHAACILFTTMPEEVPCTDGLEVSIEDLQPAAYDGTSPSSLLLTADTDTHTALASSSMLSRDADIPAHQPADQPQAGGETGVGSAQQTHVPAVSVFNSAFYASPALPTPGAAGSSTQEAADKAGSSVVPMVFGALSIGPQSSPPKEGALMPVGRSVTLAHALQAQAAVAAGYVRKEHLSTAMQPAGTVTPSAGHLFANHHRPPIRGASLSTDRMMRAPADKPVSTLVKEQSAAEAASAATARDPSRNVRPCGSPALQRHPPARGASLTAVSRMARELPLPAVPRMGGHLHSARQAFGLQPLRTPFASSGCAPRSQELQWTPSGGSDESGLMRPQSRNSPLAMSESYRQRPSIDDGGAGLHRAIKHMVLSDEAAFLRVQASLRGISSLAKETDKLQMARDPSGATCMNQYVVIKTLGKGSFGKVRLCLNTLDGKLRAIKVRAGVCTADGAGEPAMQVLTQVANYVTVAVSLGADGGPRISVAAAATCAALPAPACPNHKQRGSVTQPSILHCGASCCSGITPQVLLRRVPRVVPRVSGWAAL